MNNNTNNLSIRWLYLAVGTLSMLFAGIIYAWSILKTPLAAEFGWDASQLALNFTLTMCFFCIGGFLGSQIARKIGVSLTVILAGVLAGGGFVLTSMLSGAVTLLYVTYAIAAGLGIGVAYNVIISTVNAWLPQAVRQATASNSAKLSAITFFNIVIPPEVVLLHIGFVF